MKISTKGMPREQWLQLRRKGIGGSDAGVIAGVNNYKSVLDLYNEKTGIVPITEEDNEALRVGRDLEEYVAKRFCEATGKKVHRSNYMYISDEYPFMLADVDRLIVGEDAGLECKTVNAYGKGKFEDGDIPLSYLFQCYHYMFVTGKRTWYLAALIMGIGFKWYRIEWDEKLIPSLVSAEKQFWNNNVLKNIPPLPDGTPMYSDALAKTYSASCKGTTIELPEFSEKLEQRDELIQSIAELEKQKEQIEQEVKMAMQDAEHAICGSHRVSWSDVESNRFNAKAFKADVDKETYAKYLVRTTTRRFQVKAA